MHRDGAVMLQGRRFHYTEWGAASAPAVVMLHGITGHARTWDEEAASLADRFHVLALDQRGHGDSDPAPDADYTIAALADDLARFLDALALGRVRLVGLSLGGRVAIAYAGVHPERVEQLVVIDIGPEIAQAGRARVGGLMGNAPERFETVAEALAYQRANNPRYTEALLRRRVEHGLRPLPGGGFTWKYDRALRESVRSGRWKDPIDLWPAWKAIACPTLLVQGRESDILSDDIAQRMLQAQPRTRLLVVEGAGHTVPGDQPAAFQAALTDFLRA